MVQPWTAYGRDAALGGVLTLALLSMGAGLVSAAVLPGEWVEPWVLVSCAVGTGVAGVCMTPKAGKRGALAGGCIGAAMAALYGVSGFLLYRGIDPFWSGLVVLACLVGGGVSGVLTGCRVRKRRT